MIFNLKLLPKIKEIAEKQGLQVAALSILNKIRVKSILSKGTAPSIGPLLIISNHTGVFDGFLLLSQTKRNDFYLIALSTYSIFGPEMQEKLLPIYRMSRLNHKIYEYPLCLEVSGKTPENISQQEVKLRNRKTIDKAAELINKGNAVSIFPTGSAGKTVNGSKWKAGVGFLVKKITDPKTKVVFAQIHGTRMSDLVAFLHPIINKLFFRPQPISIQFSEEKFLNQLIDPTQDEKTITRNLEQLYYNYWKYI